MGEGAWKEHGYGWIGSRTVLPAYRSFPVSHIDYRTGTVQKRSCLTAPESYSVGIPAFQ